VGGHAYEGVLWLCWVLNAERRRWRGVGFGTNGYPPGFPGRGAWLSRAFGGETRQGQRVFWFSAGRKTLPAYLGRVWVAACNYWFN
jgi:hypothetical protein